MRGKVLGLDDDGSKASTSVFDTRRRSWIRISRSSFGRGTASEFSESLVVEVGFIDRIEMSRLAMPRFFDDPATRTGLLPLLSVEVKLIRSPGQLATDGALLGHELGGILRLASRLDGMVRCKLLLMLMSSSGVITMIVTLGVGKFDVLGRFFPRGGHELTPLWGWVMSCW